MNTINQLTRIPTQRQQQQQQECDTTTTTTTKQQRQQQQYHHRIDMPLLIESRNARQQKIFCEIFVVVLSKFEYPVLDGRK